jgi:hypothetical protein
VKEREARRCCCQKEHKLLTLRTSSLYLISVRNAFSNCMWSCSCSIIQLSNTISISCHWITIYVKFNLKLNWYKTYFPSGPKVIKLRMETSLKSRASRCLKCETGFQSQLYNLLPRNIYMVDYRETFHVRSANARVQALVRACLNLWLCA